MDAAPQNVKQAIYYAIAAILMYLFNDLSLVGSISAITSSVLNTSIPAIFPASSLRVKVQCQNRILGKVDQWFYCSYNILPVRAHPRRLS